MTDCSKELAMDTAIEQIKKSCNVISAELLRIHPATAQLDDKVTKDDLYKTLFELTKQLEKIKKLARHAELKHANDSQAAHLPPEL